MKKADKLTYHFSAPEDLDRIINQLGPLVLKVKIPEQKGQYQLAYIYLKKVKGKE